MSHSIADFLFWSFITIFSGGLLVIGLCILAAVIYTLIVNPFDLLLGAFAGLTMTGVLYGLGKIMLWMMVRL